MKIKHNIPFMFAIGLLCAYATFAVQIRSITTAGRMVQLDGFLLDWKIADAKQWPKNDSWQWDIINTKEGVTGYFKSVKPLRCGGWNFTFLPKQLSPYAAMNVSFAPTAAQTFYRTTIDSSNQKATLTAEWIIPWDSLALDSAGAYKIGIAGDDSCGDTLEAMILTGHVLRAAAASPWSKVYSKGIFLAVMLILLYYLQRTSKKKIKSKTKN